MILDKIFGHINDFLITCYSENTLDSRYNSFPTENELSIEEKKQSANLTRVNHTGEVCAQALYRGHEIMADDLHVKNKLLESAEEESSHLNWCAHRLKELKSRPSYLNPVWYTGSFCLGIIAGCFGDKVIMGFIRETEIQVANHLDDYIHKLPPRDLRSSAIFSKMREEELEHVDMASNHGAVNLPLPIVFLMKKSANFMKRLVYKGY